MSKHTERNEMREIKFREWDSHLQRMMTPQTFIEYLSHTNHNTDNTFMQYTGLKDKTGIEIYEGDIVEWSIFPSKFNYDTLEDDPLPEEKVRDYISFGDSGCWSCHNRTELLFMKEPHRKLEVIGNIHENRELLK